MTWHEIPDLKAGDTFIKKVKAGGKTVCLVGHEGEIFAVSSICPHAGADLSFGWCKNNKLVCPVHRYEYDLSTGRGNPGQNDYIDTYPVKINGDCVYVGTESFLEKFKAMFK